MGKTVYQKLKEHRALLVSLARTGIAVEDVKYIELFEEFERLKNEGLKKTYIAAHLCDEFEVSERTVWRIVSRFSRILTDPLRH